VLTNNSIYQSLIVKINIIYFEVKYLDIGIWSHPRLGWLSELPLGSFRSITEGLLKTNPKHHHDPVC